MLCVKIILLFVAFNLHHGGRRGQPSRRPGVCRKVNGESKINAFFLVCLLQIHYFCHSNKQSVNLNYLKKYHYGSTENHARPGAQASW